VTVTTRLEVLSGEPTDSDLRTVEVALRAASRIAKPGSRIVVTHERAGGLKIVAYREPSVAASE
jgi:hypothetical protein